MEKNKMLIDATHPEETRVVVLRGGRVEEFDFESASRNAPRAGEGHAGRPSLQAASEYGGNRHGFLAFSEIHPDYYQIPFADRQALIRKRSKRRPAPSVRRMPAPSGANGEHRERDRDRVAAGAMLTMVTPTRPERRTTARRPARRGGRGSTRARSRRPPETTAGAPVRGAAAAGLAAALEHPREELLSARRACLREMEVAHAEARISMIRLLSMHGRRGRDGELLAAPTDRPVETSV